MHQKLKNYTTSDGTGNYIILMANWKKKDYDVFLVTYKLTFFLNLLLFFLVCDLLPRIRESKWVCLWSHYFFFFLLYINSYWQCVKYKNANWLLEKSKIVVKYSTLKQTKTKKQKTKQKQTIRLKTNARTSKLIRFFYKRQY